MSRLFVTGDTHGETDISKLNTRRFPIQDELTKDDVMVVLGDWGGIWYGNEHERYAQKDRHTQRWWEGKPWTTFVVLGNHENYEAIAKLPVTMRFGAPVRKVSDSVFIAESGYIYTICGKKCLVVNGANSHDMWCRKEGVNWWKDEVVTQEAVDKAIESLKKVDYDIDYFFTHTGGGVATVSVGYAPGVSDIRIDSILDVLPADKDWKHYCGHLHVDKTISYRTKILYQDVLMLHNTECDIDDGACVSLFDGFRIDGESINVNSDLNGGDF